jgi:hypothetical protein
MTDHRHDRISAAILTALFALSLAGTASASSRANRLALDLDARAHGSGKKASAHSFKRRVAVHLVPMLEGLGYEVTRVHSAKKAIKSGDYAFAIHVDIDAKPMWLVHDARQYDEVVVHDSEVGISAWAEWRSYGYKKQKQFGSGKIGPIDSRVHELGGGRPEIDDEEAVARVFAGEISDRVGELVRDYTEPEVEEWIEDE